MVKLTILGQVITKKNSQQILYNRKTGKRFIGQSDRYEEYEQAALWQLKSQYHDKPIATTVNVKCLYYRQSRHRVDLINLHSSIHDILSRAGIIEDDNCRIIVSTDGSRVLYDKLTPRVEVYIEQVIADEWWNGCK